VTCARDANPNGLAASALTLKSLSSISQTDAGGWGESWESHRTHMGASPGITLGLPGAPPASAGPHNITQAYGQPAAGTWASNGRGRRSNSSTLVLALTNRRWPTRQTGGQKATPMPAPWSHLARRSDGCGSASWSGSTGLVVMPHIKPEPWSFGSVLQAGTPIPN
jgi:hypothetical protein